VFGKLEKKRNKRKKKENNLPSYLLGPKAVGRPALPPSAAAAQYSVAVAEQPNSLLYLWPSSAESSLGRPSKSQQRRATSLPLSFADTVGPRIRDAIPYLRLVLCSSSDSTLGRCPAPPRPLVLSCTPREAVSALNSELRVRAALLKP
jgi:hypothetical protein